MMLYHNIKKKVWGYVAASCTALMLVTLYPSDGFAQASMEQRMQLLEATLKDLLDRDVAKDKEIARLKRALGNKRGVKKKAGQSGHSDHGGHSDHHGSHSDPHDSHDEALASTVIQGRKVALDYLGLSVNMAGGYSSEPSAVSQNLTAGGHDPKASGFRLQAADFAMMGSVERAFDAELHIAFHINQLTGATVVDLEEAFMRTNSLPYGFDIEAGHMFTEFGVHNPKHLHDWEWIDQPVVMSRMFGPDGMRQTGMRVGWETPKVGLWKAHFHVGAQNPTGETMKSFLNNDETLSDRTRNKGNVNGLDDLVYLTRWDNRFDFGKTKIRAGFSGVYGPNATGQSANTQIYGMDLTVKHALAKKWDLRWTNELMYRRFQAAFDEAGGFEADNLIDHGFYTQVALEFNNTYWAGLRYERATGSGDEDTRDSNSDLDQRQRYSPIVGWRFAPNGNLRLQYNYDKADHLNEVDTKDDPSAHAFWFGLDWTFGAGSKGHHDH